MRQPDSSELRDALGAFVTGVTVVTTLDGDHEPRGFTANSFTSVSLEPPLVLVCIGKAAGSSPVFQEARGFAVNILAEDQRDVSHAFASGRRDRFATVRWIPGPAGNPVFQGAAAWVDCAAQQKIDAGDHVILIGRVIGCGHAPLKPLGYCRGAYVTFGLEQRVVAAEGRNACVGVILEGRDGLLLIKNPATGGLALPTAASLGKPDGEGGLFGVLRWLGVAADLGFLFAVFEDDASREVAIYYRGTALSAPAGGAPARFFPLEAIPWPRLPTDAVRNMLRRYVTERREDRFGIYVGDAVSGKVAALEKAG